MELFRLFGSIVIDDKEAIKALQEADKQGSEAQKSLDSTFGKVGKAAKLAGALIATGFTAILAEGVSGSMDAENAAAQLEAVITSTGGAAGMTKEQLISLADGYEKTTKFTSESVQAGEAMLLTFTNIGSSVFPQATQAAADMAQALGTDMSTQSMVLGKALNDPVAGISKLTKVGVTFTEQQKEQIKAMAEAGDTAGAQSIILAELNKEFGGSAVAAGDTLSGKLVRLKNAFGDIAETLVTSLIPYLQKFADWVIQNMPQIKENAVKVLGDLKDAFTFVKEKADIIIPVLAGLVAGFIAFKIIGVISALITVWTTVTGAASVAMGALNIVMSANPIGLVIIAIAALIAIGVALYMNWGTVKEKCAEAFGKIKEIVSGAKEAIGTAINAIKTVISNVFGTIKDIMLRPFNDAKSAISTVIDGIKGFLNFNWSFPKLKMPHFSVSGSMNPLKWFSGGLPKLNVAWYAKGGIFDQPTMFNTPYGMKGVGEAGPEAITPISVLQEYVGKAVAEQNQGVTIYLQKLIDLLATYFPEIMENMGRDIVMDTGVLVGHIDRSMGSIYSGKERGA